MNQLCLAIASRLAAHASCRAISAGIGLGAAFWLICSLRAGDAFSYVMGIVLLLSGSASFVLYMLGSAPAAQRATHARRVQHWVMALGLGMLLSVNGMDLLFG